MSKGWIDLCSTYYTIAIRGDLGKRNAFGESEALKRWFEKHSQTDTTAYHLLLAYLAWDDCRADPTYCFPYND